MKCVRFSGHVSVVLIDKENTLGPWMRMAAQRVHDFNHLRLLVSCLIKSNKRREEACRRHSI